ncbi:MAG: hypothetical protein ABL858_08500 [Candidatus Nitrotoga sp.]
MTQPQQHTQAGYQDERLVAGTRGVSIRNWNNLPKDLFSVFLSTLITVWIALLSPVFCHLLQDNKKAGTNPAFLFTY